MNSPILHVMVVGFHHTKGSQVEYCYPTLQEEGGEVLMPRVWENLPNLAMPDGSHNSPNGDTVYFTLPSSEDSRCTVFGIACYKHIDSKKLLQKEADVTRSHVQKSVVVLSRIPLYGNLRAKLELITEAYFNEKDFTKVGVLEQTFNNLTDMFTYDLMDNQAIYMGIPLYSLLMSFKHRTLELVKLLLLEKKIIFDITPTSRLSNVLMGLISLFPCTLEDGLTECAVTSKSGCHSESLNTNDYGFPLSIFTKGYLFHPYLSVNWIEQLRSDNVRGYCIGVTNGIFQSNKDLYDAYVTIDASGAGSINISDHKLQKLVDLTTQDVRFMQNILQGVENSTPSDFTGNDDWVRVQVYSYICSLLIVGKNEKSEHCAEYNSEFLTAWRDTHNFRVWNAGNHEPMPDVVAEHPCSGPIGAQDFLLIVGRKFNNSGQGRKVINTINSTAKYMSEQGSRLKSSFSTWISRPSHS
ncbi:unnamed protein product [Bursaphelenchus xylophilus]|uniref:(pine wood nematode) hypothetical protein n=1 Tax=Bursaphelenchus xylophilus TaxID=6326 RepID=A0A1I7STP2_BURXY|nr:unnamed protein product [Bursaphelenchus xylophilus]CAG9108152.1 unnamed protein product [Bursaphelenchus xylophilus]